MQKLYDLWFGGRLFPRGFVAFIIALLMCGVLKMAYKDSTWPYVAEAIVLIFFAFPTVVLVWWHDIQRRQKGII